MTAGEWILRMPSWLFPGMPPVKFLRQKICSIFPAWVSGERHCHLLLLYQESKLLPKRKIPQVELSLKLKRVKLEKQKILQPMRELSLLFLTYFTILQPEENFYNLKLQKI